MIIKLFGDVVSDEYTWVYELFEIPCFSPKTVREAIQALPDDEDLILEVNSPGGDVWAGFEIYGLLQGIAGRTEAHIIGLAASAATTITSACSRVLASPVAQFMIHQPSALAGFVNNAGARQLQNFLDSIKESIINGYVTKSGGKANRKTFERLVDNSTYMPAQDAIRLGLVDGYLDTTEEQEARLDDAGPLVIGNAAAGPTTQALLERYESAVKAGLMEEVPEHPVSREDAKPAASVAQEANPDALPLPSEDLAVTVSREIVENLIMDWRLQAAIDLQRARAV